jgi:CRISPR-associated endonuclease Csn1
LLQAFGLHGLVFLQRTMYWPKSVVGECELERNQKRCPVADRRFQRFRMLQEVNNLRYIDQQQKPPQELPLSADQRTLLLDKLARREEMTFDQIRKALGFLESVQFNLERGKRSKLKGQTVDVQLAKAMGKAWHDRPDEQKDAVVRVLANPALDERVFVERATREWEFSPEEAEALLEVDLPSGYGSLSLMAINKLLPHLEKGLPFQAQNNPERSALHAAGYLRRDELRRRLFERLPDPKRTRDCPVADLPNPVVRRALTELRKVVNAVIREYGRPDHVHLEMGRDLKTRPKPGTKGYRKYQEQLERNSYREKLREQAVEKLRENQIAVSRDNIIRYLLWQEQNETCVYSGNPISIRQLFGQDIDVDHILPRSRTLDDSQMNKVVCFRQTSAALGNHDKGNRTPNEWLADAHPKAYAAVCQRAKKLPYPKYRRFLQKELELDDFIARQLNDSRYIARLAGEYLRCLFEKDHQVLGLKGQLTAELRHQWGLDTILAELPDSPAWREQSRLRPGEKNRADHRHHAVDAVVIAMTNRSRLQKLARMCEAGGVRRTGEILEDPRPNFRDDISDAVARLRVSRRVERKIAGALHEETLYGKVKDKPGEWVVRKPLESLSPAEVERIRDDAIRKIVLDRLREHGIDVGRGKSASPKQWKAAVADLRMPSGVPIKKLRVLKHDLTIRPIRSGENTAYVKPGSTHHLCIFEWEERGKKKREPVFVAMLEAIRRVKAGEPLIQRDHPERPDAKFVMSLGRGELVLADWDGEEKLLVYRTAASTQGQIYFVEHCDARKDKDAKKYVATANSLIGARKARKVTVDPLGRVRWAGD